jgi:CysZ protein
MLNAITLALTSLNDRRVQMVLGKSIVLTLVAFGLLGVAGWYAMDAIFQRMGVKDSSLSALAIAALMLLGGWLLFRLIAIAILWVFSDEIVDAVEMRHYAQHAELAQRPTMGRSLAMALRSAMRALGYNLLALPVYLMLLITGIGAPIIFLGVNALLLGKDLDGMLAFRHRRDGGALGKGERLLLGGLATAAMLLPVVNLLIPVIATAAAVHLTHRRDVDRSK